VPGQRLASRDRWRERRRRLGAADGGGRVARRPARRVTTARGSARRRPRRHRRGRAAERRWPSVELCFGKLAVRGRRRTASRGSCAIGHQSPSKTGCSLRREGAVGALEVLGLHADRLRLRLGLDRASIHAPFLVEHLLGHRVREGRPVGKRRRAPALRRADCRPGRAGCRTPSARPRRPSIVRPVKSSSAARPWPMMRGRIAQAPMSQPASPTRVNRNAVFAARCREADVGGHREDRTGAGAHPVDRGDDRLRAGGASPSRDRRSAA
jgi:hypothetical protein